MIIIKKRINNIIYDHLMIKKVNTQNLITAYYWLKKLRRETKKLYFFDPIITSWIEVDGRIISDCILSKLDTERRFNLFIEQFKIN